MKIKGTSKNSHLACCGRFLKAQREFLNGCVSKVIRQEKKLFLEPKGSTTQRATNFYGFWLRPEINHSPF